ncbi:MAG TPA: DUF2750 domain-containing protein [Gemmatimonadaceae bacterium]|nr:DUF2750 domain-containing protein [Gemmatimonadaceae bacterium]
MSRSLVNAAAFIREVTADRRLWTVRGLDAAPRGLTGELAKPFWSTLERAQRAIATGKLGGGPALVELTWSDFVQEWAPRLERAAICVGPNWGGPDATGGAWPVARVIRAVQDLTRS